MWFLATTRFVQSISLTFQMTFVDRVSLRVVEVAQLLGLFAQSKRRRQTFRLSNTTPAILTTHQARASARVVTSMAHKQRPVIRQIRKFPLIINKLADETNLSDDFY